MSRPLVQNGIGQLEEMFEAGVADHQTLEALEHELKFRSVPRAATLLNRVRRAINGAGKVAETRQSALFEHEPVKVGQAPLPLTAVAPVDQSLTRDEHRLEPLLSLEEAYKILRVSSGASWEAIEQSRRAIVELTRPDRIARLSDEKRLALLKTAMMANAACDALSRARRFS